MVVIPLSIGIFLKIRFEKRLQPFIAIFPAISVTFIVFICSLVAALNRNFISQMSMFILLIVFLLNISGYSLGYAVAKLAKLNIKRRRTLSIEIGMQNAGLGTVLALKYFSEQAALPAALFVIVSVVTSSLLARFWHRGRIN